MRRVRPVCGYGIKLSDAHEITRLAMTRPEILRGLLQFGAGVKARSSRAAAVINGNDKFSVGRCLLRKSRVVTLCMRHERRSLTRGESDGDNKKKVFDYSHVVSK